MAIFWCEAFRSSHKKFKKNIIRNRWSKCESPKTAYVKHNLQESSLGVILLSPQCCFYSNPTCLQAGAPPLQISIITFQFRLPRAHHHPLFRPSTPTSLFNRAGDWGLDGESSPLSQTNRKTTVILPGPPCKRFYSWAKERFRLIKSKPCAIWGVNFHIHITFVLKSSYGRKSLISCLGNRKRRSKHLTASQTRTPMKNSKAIIHREHGHTEGCEAIKPPPPLQPPKKKKTKPNSFLSREEGIVHLQGFGSASLQTDHQNQSEAVCGGGRGKEGGA